MIYAINSKPPAPRVQKALRFFLRAARASAPDLTNSHFPKWFVPVVLAGGETGLWGKFEQVFKELQRQDRSVRDRFLCVFDQCNNIESLCSDTRYNIPSFVEFPPTLIRQVEVLTDHLYKTLKSGIICANAMRMDQPCLSWHYLRFRRKHSVCPFCGLMNYPSSGERNADYDHYLYRAIYPLSVANGANLVPMCERCNQAPNKHIRDVLRNGLGERRKTYYPYGDCGGLDIKCEIRTTAALNRKASWEVRFSPKRGKTEKEEFDTWLEVFNIKSRYEGLLNNDGWMWIRNEIAVFTPEETRSLDSIRRHFKKRSRELFDAVDTIEKAIVQAPLFECVANLSDDMVKGLIGVAGSDYSKRLNRRTKNRFPPIQRHK